MSVTSPHSAARGARAARAAVVAIAVVASAAIAVVAACSPGDARARRVSVAGAVPPRSPADGAPTRDSSGAGYRVTALPVFGRVTGVVRLVGDAPPDTTIRPTSDEDVCGVSFAEPLIGHDHAALEEAVVWIGGVPAGKRAPIERKLELTNSDCRLEPRVQAAVAGTTLNIRSDDRAIHRNRFLDLASGDVLALVTETDDGMVVPDEHVLAHAGTVEVRCDQHPWTRAWIASFDHPYFAVTERGGVFALDSVPPGRYAVAAWHPRLGRVTDSVTVAAGTEARIELRLRAR